MACFSPLSAWQDAKTRRFLFDQDSRRESGPTMLLPCRQCVGCRLDMAAEKALRCVHESKSHEACWFLTLTVDDAHFPHSFEEWRSSFDRGLKRIRHALLPDRIRTFGCLELGEGTMRPHGHLLGFGSCRPERGEVVGRGPAGCSFYDWPVVRKAWGLGHVSVGEFTPESASYVARYTEKKRSTRDARGELVEVVHPVTGEVVLLPPSWPWAVSRRPGIGAEWFERFGMRAVEDGAVTLLGGVRVPVPAYYRRLAKRIDPLAGAQAAADAAVRAVASAGERTPEALAIRRQVFVARTSSLKRGGV